jgi:hypothetical protein
MPVVALRGNYNYTTWRRGRPRVAGWGLPLRYVLPGGMDPRWGGVDHMYTPVLLYKIVSNPLMPGVGVRGLAAASVVDSGR